MIDSRGELVHFYFAVSEAGKISPQSRRGCLRDLLYIGLSKRNDSIGGNLVVQERVAGSRIDDRAHAGEISHAQRIRGERGRHGDSLEDATAFIVGEKEGAVSFYGSAQAGTELVLTEMRFPEVKEVPRVQHLISEKFVNHAIDGIRSRACRNVDLSPAVAAKLSGIIAGVNPKFLDGIYRGRHRKSIVNLIADHDSIEQEDIVLVPGAIGVYREA